MPFSIRVDNLILDCYVKNTASWTAPADWYVGFSSTTPTKDGSTGSPPANVTEPSGGAYARKQVPPSSWASASGSAITTTAEVAFVKATADWLSAANLTHVAFVEHVSNAISGTNYLGFADVADKPVTQDDTAKIASGDIDISIGGT